MKLSKLVNKCQLEKIVFCTNCEIENGYCGDLMSDVMAHAEAECIWITIQAHKNSIAVALIKDIRSIVFTNNVKVEKEVIEKAEEEKINLLRTNKDSFTVCGEIYGLMEAETAKD